MPEEQNNLDIERKKRFGKYLREARGHDMTQGTLSKAWGKSQSSISDFENGRRIPDLEDIPPLAAALGRPIAEVMKKAGYDNDIDEAEKDEVLLYPGKRVRILLREGEPGTQLYLDTTDLEVLDALARSKKASKKTN